MTPNTKQKTSRKPFWDRRMDICMKCPYFRGNSYSATCDICKCYLIAKTKIPTMHCPKEKW